MSLPFLPRVQWSQHPNFPAHALLLGSHENFGRLNRHLIQDVEGTGDLVAAEFLYRRWISAMRSHERYEEEKLYPYLARRYRTPMDEGAFAEATKGHAELHQAHDAVIQAFQLSERSAVGAALRKHEEVLKGHLQHEEDLVIPLLLELEPEEFREYYQGHPAELMAKLAARGY